MASTKYTNVGPIYLTQENYEAKLAAGTLESGREYRITDWEAQEKMVDAPTVDGTYVLQATVTDGVVAYAWVAK